VYLLSTIAVVKRSSSRFSETSRLTSTNWLKINPELYQEQTLLVQLLKELVVGEKDLEE